jgi:hypothetical protein
MQVWGPPPMTGRSRWWGRARSGVGFAGAVSATGLCASAAVVRYRGVLGAHLPALCPRVLPNPSLKAGRATAWHLGREVVLAYPRPRGPGAKPPRAP